MLVRPPPRHHPPPLSTESSSSVLGCRQGVLVSGSDEGRFLLDDGSGVVELLFSAESQPQQWKMGMYVMVVGPYVAAQSNDISTIKVHKIVDLSEQPDREAMWNLEVIEAHKLFYLTSPE
ncbi:recQ-mediated genome instability protein 2-like isoform X2 [Zingiber officinale]|uniref:recQ-mediated genome instability protein 2-like isoform X2 n=1 Tax=Zingiber officinale TaxID=94328 RepID=UPI001C4B8849|nr:recQ-mediated genome instability protein 2-like isoform X2 [Zingiber officinale]